MDLGFCRLLCAALFKNCYICIMTLDSEEPQRLHGRLDYNMAKSHANGRGSAQVTLELAGRGSFFWDLVLREETECRGPVKLWDKLKTSFLHRRRQFRKGSIRWYQ